MNPEKKTMLISHRERIYAFYLSRRQSSLAPTNVEGLRGREPYLRAIIKSHLPDNRKARILDVGCGHGAFVRALHEAGYADARGVDHSAEQVEAARRLGIEGVQQGELLDTLRACHAGSLDVIIAFDVLEHFAKDELVTILDEMHRVLGAKGRLIIHAPNGESPFGNRILFWDFTHELAFTRESIAQLLMVCGFLRVKCYEDRPVVHGLKSAIRRVLWSVIRAFWRFYLAVETGSGEKACIFSQNFLTVADKQNWSSPENCAHRKY